MKPMIGMTRNVFILSICQALGFSIAPFVSLVGGIVGTQLAPNPIWSTLPVACVVVGTALFTFPASRIMRAIGRRNGFSLFALIAALASLLAAYAIGIESFYLFCLATLILGGNIAFVLQYRFAAAESVKTPDVSKAVSFVLGGGVVAAFLGPEIAEIGQDWLDAGAFAGSFLILCAVLLLSALLLRFLSEASLNQTETDGDERPLREIMKQPLFIVALIASALSMGTMNFIFTATPISMHVLDGYSVNMTALVIQSHVMAMYIPSFFTGLLISRFGELSVMLAGVLSMAICFVAAFASQAVIAYWIALVAMGIGWNFLFLGGTSLLTQTYRPSEKFKSQGAHDSVVFGLSAVTALSAGAVVHVAGWKVVALATIPPILIMGVAIGIYWMAQQRSDPR